MDVGAWLRGLDLGQYEPAFRENEIDAAVLSRLTADDLRDMGVTIVGHRRKLLDAIAALRAGGEPPSSQPTDAAPALQAERRQLRSCSPTWSAPQPSPRGSIRRSCARCSAPIRTRPPAR